ncbi:SSI family serine proteinase inhibitor [Streptomyces sp. NPDC005281]|uniref:SSI family serine proteinase inhibitor n=1 Tax=Streptomyces sp. NPDC005281 TaxID=3155712 RepID=UPI0033BF3AD7
MLRRLLLTAAVSATAALSWVPGATAGTVSDAPGTAPVPMESQSGPSGPLTVFTGFAGGPPSLFSAGPSRAAARAAAVAYGLALPALMPPPARPEDSSDRLTVTVDGVGGGADGTFELECHPAGGTHPRAAEACDRLDRMTTWGKDTFAPVPPDALCTMEYGGPATAHVTGNWAGRPVDARYDRSNGCEISRWNALMPVLPGTLL